MLLVNGVYLLGVVGMFVGCVQDLYAAMNKMSDPSMIRVESDELTYPMHIILRYTPPTITTKN